MLQTNRSFFQELVSELLKGVGRVEVLGESSSEDWVGGICTLDMARKDGRGGFQIHPVLAVTGRTVAGQEELVPGFVDQFNHVNHSLNFHQVRLETS